MAIGLFGSLHIGKEGLFTQQSAIGVTGHNIANVNTPGYSRQKPVIEALDAQRIGLIYFGRGAQLTDITKSYDKFLNHSIALESSLLGKWEARETYMMQTETIFNESGDLGLNYMLDRFWDAWNDLADHPEGMPERSVVQSTGQGIAATLQAMGLNLETVRNDANNRLINTISEINQLGREIAHLNGQILVTEASGTQPNDLTDQRTLRVEQMSKLIDITVLDGVDGQLTILTGAGRPLVAENISWNLSVKADIERDGFYSIYHNDDGVETDITDKIQGGELRGVLQIRDEVVPRYLRQLDQLASSLIIEVNRLHYSGYGLDGSTENYFFTPVTLTADEDDDNRGGVKIYDPQTTNHLDLAGSEYNLKFVSSSPQISRYEIYDETNEEYVYRIDAGNSTIVFDDGAGDVIVSLDRSTYTGDELAAELESKLDAHASVNQEYSVRYDNSVRKFTIINKGSAAIDIKWENSITTAAQVFGFNAENKAAIASNASLESDSTAGTYTYAAQLFQITSGANDTIVFRDDGTATDRSATLDAGVYTADELAVEIKKQMEGVSGAAQTYTVSFNDTSQKFRIINDGTNANGLSLRWASSEATSTLGFDEVNSGVIATGLYDESDNSRYIERKFVITGANNEIVYNDGGAGGNITACLTEGEYTGEELAAEIESQMEKTPGSSGQEYIVSFDTGSGSFAIINSEENSHSVDLLWSGSTAASVLGFNAVDSGAIAANSYDLSDNVAGAASTYDTVGFYGISVKLTDETAVPQSLDSFSISTIKNAAKTMEMNSLTATDPEKIAVSKNVFIITGQNNKIVFDDDGDLTDGISYEVVIPNGTYSPDELVSEIESQLENNGSGQSYAVEYSTTTNKFTISSNTGNANQLFVLWENSDTTADFILGFNNEIFTVTEGSNDTISFDDGSGGGPETAILAAGTYSGEALATEIKRALEEAGATGFETSVSYSSTSRQFLITVDGTAGAGVDLNWSASNAASTLGFDPVDSSNIAVDASDSSDFSPGGLTAGFSATGDFSTGGADPGNNRNALDMAKLRETNVLNHGNLSINSFYDVFIGEVGIDVDLTKKNITHESFVMEQFEQRRQSIAGVSIDEEMINLIKYQQSFAASAKFITTLDQMLGTVLSIKS